MSASEPAITLGDNFEIDEDGDDAILRHVPSGAEFRYNASASEWQITDDLNLSDNDITNVGSFSADDYNSAVFVAGSDSYPTIQDAVDALETKDAGAQFPEMSLQEIWIPPSPTDRDETVDIATNHTGFYGHRGQSTYITTTADDHTFFIDENDVYLEHLGVHHEGTGNWDAIHVAPGHDEAVLYNCTCDWAPRYGFNIQSPHSRLISCEATGGDDAALRVGDVDHVQVTGLKVQTPPSDGVLIEGSNGLFTGIVDDPGGDGVIYDGFGSIISFHITDPEGDGFVHENGDHNLINVVSNNATATGINITGSVSGCDNNTYLVNTNGDVSFGTATAENVLYGAIEGTTTDNGVRNIINGVGTNSGDPSTTGDWNGSAALAHEHGAVIWDSSTSPATPYRADPSGNWVAI